MSGQSNRFELGSDVAGYRLEAVVGRGGMGVVYRATNLALGRTYALKVLAPEALAELLVLREARREDLERVRPAERQVRRPVHDAHPAAPGY
jgi:serine/threonine protein kinase